MSSNYYNLIFNKSSNIILNLDTKITLFEVNQLQVCNLVNFFDFDLLKKFNLNSVEQFLQKFKNDCNFYMLANDTISINEYLNFLFAAKF